MTARRIALAVVVVSGTCSISLAGLGAIASMPVAASTSGPIAYVTDYGDSGVIPFDTTTKSVGNLIPGVGDSDAIAIAPDGLYAYVVTNASGTVTPIDLTTNTLGSPVHVFAPLKGGGITDNIAITPDGKTAYIASFTDNTVVPIDLTSQTPGRPIIPGTPIHVGSGPNCAAITPNGKTVYICDWGAKTVTPIATATNKPGKPIKVAGGPSSIAITPDGKTAYVANQNSDTVTLIATATNKIGASIRVGHTPIDIAVSPDGKTAYVANGGTHSPTQRGGGTVTPIATATNKAGAPINVGGGPSGVVFTPNGKTAYVVGNDDETVTPIATATRTPGPQIQLPGLIQKIAIAPDQAPVAQLSVTPQPAGSGIPTEFDASASVAPSSPIVSYRWNFGDGQAATTSSPTTTHVYTAADTYTASVTETDTAGTSTSRVFTGETMSRNGGPSAVATAKFVIVSCTSTETCAGSLSVPQTPTVQSQVLQFSGTPSAAEGTVHFAVAPAALVCPNEDPAVAPIAELTNTGFAETTQLTIKTTLHNTIRASAHEVCYDSEIPFRSQANPTVPTAGTALLLDCTDTANVAPCVVSTRQVGPDVVVTFVVPGGDPRFHVVQPGKVHARIPALAAGVRGHSYTSKFEATDGTNPIACSWKLVSGSLPAGLKLNSNGTITGTPTTGGFKIFKVRASDHLTPPQTADMTASINVK